MQSSLKTSAAAGAPNTPPESSVKKPIEVPIVPGITVLAEQQIVAMLAIGVLVYFLAAGFANEWLYLLSAGFITASVLGFFLPLMQLIDVEVDTSMPDELHDSQEADITVRLRKLFVFGLVSSIIPTRWLRVHLDFVRRGVLGQKPEHIFPPQPLLVETVTDELWLAFATPKLTRGIYRLEAIELESCFPFGLAWWKRTIRKQQDLHGNPLSLTVYPQTVPVAGNFLLALNAITSTMGLRSSNSKAVLQSTSVRGVREFKVGDSTRHIHWPSTARLGKLLVREFDNETLPVFDLLLDLEADWSSREQFELAVCVLHSLVRLGYNLGCVPELFLNPPLNSTIVAEQLMFDLPQTPQGMKLLSEILARVEPLNAVEQPTKRETSDIEDWRSIPRLGERPLLTVLPQQVSQSAATSGGGQSTLVLAVASSGPLEGLWETQNEMYERSLSLRQRAAQASVGTELRREAAASILATISGEGDLSAL
jgi:hypothetical protein